MGFRSLPPILMSALFSLGFEFTKRMLHLAFCRFAKNPPRRHLGFRDSALKRRERPLAPDKIVVAGACVAAINLGLRRLRFPFDSHR